MSGVALGAGIGLVFGAAFSAPGVGMVLGAAVGLTGILGGRRGRKTED